jgi:hypothetical protein
MTRVSSTGEKKGDSATGSVGVLSARERSERFSKRHSRQGVVERKKRTIRVCRQREKESRDSPSGVGAGRRREKETSDSANSPVGVLSAIDDSVSGAAGVLSE